MNSFLLAYVGAQWLGRAMSELRWGLYGPIEQRTRRRLAGHALAHLHELSLGFHLARRTGQISRILEQGLYHAACSDAHRPSDVQEVERGMKRIEKLYGSDECNFLFREGPLALLSGQLPQD